MGSPVKRSRNVVASISCVIAGDYNFGLVYRDCPPRKSILRKAGKLGENHVVKFSKDASRKNSGEKCPLRGVIRKCAPHDPCSCREAWESAQSVYEPRIRINLHFTFVPKQGQFWHHLRKIQRNKHSWSTPEHRCRCCARRTEAKTNWKLSEDAGTLQWW